MAQGSPGSESRSLHGEDKNYYFIAQSCGGKKDGPPTLDDDDTESAHQNQLIDMMKAVTCAAAVAACCVMAMSRMHGLGQSNRYATSPPSPVARSLPPSTSPQRPSLTHRSPRVKLIYKHLAKTGGQAVVQYLHAEYRAFTADGTMKILTERDPVTLKHAEDAFVISNVRNPCALYVSLWAFGIEGKGRYHQSFVAEHQNDTVLSKVFSTTTADHRAMAAFTRASQGEFSRRYREYVPDLAAVDCWVHTENMEADLARCLLRFATEAGPEMRHRFAERRAPGKAVAEYNVHGTSHGLCHEYFDNDPSLKALVLHQDAHIFDNFPEYSHKCCSKPDDGARASAAPTSTIAHANHTQPTSARQHVAPVALAAATRPGRSSGGDGGVEGASSSIKGSGFAGQRPPLHPSAEANAVPGGIFVNAMSDPRFAHRGILNNGSDIGQLAWQREKARPVVERLGWALHDRAAANYNCEWLGQEDLESYHTLQEIVRKRAYTSVEAVEQLARTWYVSLGLYGLMSALEEGANRHHWIVAHEGKHRVGVVATELAQGRRNRCLDGVSALRAPAIVDSTNMSSGLSLCELYPISFDGYQHGLLIGASRALAAKATGGLAAEAFWAWSSSTAACKRGEGEARGEQGLKSYASCVHGIGHTMIINANIFHRLPTSTTTAMGMGTHEARDVLAQALLSLRWCHSAPTRAEGCQAAAGVWMEATMRVFHIIPSADMLPYCIRSDEFDVYDPACFRRYWMSVTVQLLGPTSAYSTPPPDRCLSDVFLSRGMVRGSGAHAACVFAHAEVFYSLSISKNKQQLTPKQFCSAFASVPKWLELCVYGAMVRVARDPEGIKLIQVISRTADHDAMVSRACEHFIPDEPEGSNLHRVCVQGLLAYYELATFDPCGHKVLDVMSVDNR